MKQHINIVPERDNQSISNEVNKRPDFYLDDEDLEKLKVFCQTFDPYSELSLEVKFKLKEYGVTDLENPFESTNRLLMILENNLQYRESLND